MPRCRPCQPWGAARLELLVSEARDAPTCCLRFVAGQQGALLSSTPRSQRAACSCNSLHCIGANSLHWHQFLALAPIPCIGTNSLHWHQFLALAPIPCIGTNSLHWHRFLAGQEGEGRRRALHTQVATCCLLNSISPLTLFYCYALQAKKEKGGAAPATPAASTEAGGKGGKGGDDECTVDLLDIRVGQIVKVREQHAAFNLLPYSYNPLLAGQSGSKCITCC